jgi:hypothetical protein
MEEHQTLEQILKRLDLLISLELQKAPGHEKVPMGARIQRLRDLGIPTSEIASILNKTANYVTATISQRKKAGERKGGVSGD